MSMLSSEAQKILLEIYQGKNPEEYPKKTRESLAEWVGDEILRPLGGIKGDEKNELLSLSKDRRRADYFFPDERFIIEIKSLNGADDKDSYMQEKIRKLYMHQTNSIDTIKIPESSIQVVKKIVGNTIGKSLSNVYEQSKHTAEDLGWSPGNWGCMLFLINIGWSEITTSQIQTCLLDGIFDRAESDQKNIYGYFILNLIPERTAEGCGFFASIGQTLSFGDTCVESIREFSRKLLNNIMTNKKLIVPQAILDDSFSQSSDIITSFPAKAWPTVENSIAKLSWRWEDGQLVYVFDLDENEKDSSFGDKIL